MRKLVAVVTVGGALSVAAAAPASAAVTAPYNSVLTVSRTGSYGSLVSSGYVTCTADDGNVRNVGAPRTRVTRAPSYRNSTQAIWAIPRVEYYSGGWRHYKWGTWQKVSTQPGYDAVFGHQSWSVPRGYSWRVSILYRWQVGTTTIGEVTNYYAASGYKLFDYRSTDVRILQGVMQIGNTAWNRSSYCYMP